MKYGEIIIEALRMMDIIGDEIQIPNLAELAFDDSYRDYLTSMRGAINRAISDIEIKRIAPSRSRLLSRTDAESAQAYLRFDLTKIDDLYSVERVTRVTKSGLYNPSETFYIEGKTLIVSDYDDSQVSLSVTYKPLLKRYGINDTYEGVIDLPDGIAGCVPYFVKGDLFRIDEPSEASEARSWYEQMVSAYDLRESGRQSAVVSAYNITSLNGGGSNDY